MRPGGSVRSPGGRGQRGRVAGRAAGVAMGLACAGWTGGAVAQEVTELLTTELPYPSYQPVQRDHYVHRIGPVRVRYDLSVSAIFTDNRNYESSGDEDSDFGLRPSFNLGLFYPISARQRLQIDVGIGYQWWSETSESTGLYVAPSSHIDYSFGIGNTQFRLSNSTSSSTEASSRPEFAGGRDALDVAFHQVNNNTRLTAAYGTGRLMFAGGYGFGITRSLNDEFTSLDRDLHSLNGSAEVEITPPLSAGLSATYSRFSYVDAIQNDGQSYSVGPIVRWQPLRTLQISANVGYSESFFEDSGSIMDQEDFSGIVYNVDISHTMNRWVTHSANFSRSADPGFGSNYTDQFIIGYRLVARLSDRLTSSLDFRYNSASISGASEEDANLYYLTLGAGYQVLRRASLGLSYSINIRDSNLPDRGYLENRVTVTASYSF